MVQLGFSEYFNVDSYELNWFHLCPTGFGRAQKKLNWVQLYSDPVSWNFNLDFMNSTGSACAQLELDWV